MNLIIDERRFRPNICVKGNKNIMYVVGISILHFLSSEMMIWVKILFEFLGSKSTTHVELSGYVIKIDFLTNMQYPYRIVAFINKEGGIHLINISTHIIIY